VWIEDKISSEETRTLYADDFWKVTMNKKPTCRWRNTWVNKKAVRHFGMQVSVKYEKWML
jgi:hypothetical protein